MRSANVRRWAAGAAGLFLLAAALLAASVPLRAAGLPLAIGAKPVDLTGLENVVRLSEKLYSGGVPVGDAGFQSLRRLGIRAVISVDGLTPEVERARRYGMRCVHLPFGYDGCPVPTARAIVKAVRDLPGPVYLHCHHGRHRSPTAAAYARIALDGVSNEEAVREMERAGTGKNYTGLYGGVREFRPPSKEELDGLRVDLPETAPLEPLTRTMVQLDQRFDRVVRLQKEGWKPAKGADPAYEALQLQELFTELNRSPEVQRRPADFRRWMAEGEQDGKRLEAALRARRGTAASALLGRIAAGCGACHAGYRNVPQPGTTE